MEQKKSLPSPHVAVRDRDWRKLHARTLKVGCYSLSSMPARCPLLLRSASHALLPLSFRGARATAEGCRPIWLLTVWCVQSYSAFSNL